jgi:hypothetical protein
MADQIAIPDPSQEEEVRLLAKSLSELAATVDVIVSSAGELLPGEAVEELTRAWDASRLSFAGLVKEVLALTERYPSTELTIETLAKHELLGKVGNAKRSMLTRLGERFYSYWKSVPHTEEKVLRAGEAATDYLDYGATIAGSIPGAGSVEEILLLIKQAIGHRAKRGH